MENWHFRSPNGATSRMIRFSTFFYRSFLSSIICNQNRIDSHGYWWSKVEKCNFSLQWFFHFFSKTAQYDFMKLFPFKDCISAARPAVTFVDAMYDLARVSTHVASHTRHLPLVQAIRLMPSGRLPLALKSPIGSSVSGLTCLPALKRHFIPCVP